MRPDCSNTCALTVDHGGPVEAVDTFASGTVFVSAGVYCGAVFSFFCLSFVSRRVPTACLCAAGLNYLRVWDAIAGKMLTQVENHQKTITGNRQTEYT
jgi:hypothetical protein